MKKNKFTVQRVALTLAILCLLTGTVLASETTTRTLTAYFSGIKIVVDGVAVTPKDANGNAVEPFIVDGTTYLPVRAVAEALGKEVGWDGDTRTVYIGQQPGKEINWMKEVPVYLTQDAKVYTGDPQKSFKAGGYDQTKGVVLEGTGDKYAYAVWNTNGLYKSMTFTACPIKITNESKNNFISIYINGEFWQWYEMKTATPPMTITVPLNYAGNVKIMVGVENASIAYHHNEGIYDISFEK